LVDARDAAADVDLVELRLDGVADVSARGAINGRRRPVIVTCRPWWEGGRFDGAEERRRQLLIEALDAGAEYVDVEWAAEFTDVIARDPRRVVVSSHDFGGVPADLVSRAAAMRRLGASMIKIAITAVRLSDVVPLMEIARDDDAVVIAMGDAGLPSRLLATRFGSRWTYAGHSAPGQIPAASMLDEFRFRTVGRDTAIYGVVGSNVMHSLSPPMHNAAFAAAGLNAVYVPFRAADFDDFLLFAESLEVHGASVTIPFKVDALDAASHADDLARLVGAANTMRRAGTAAPAGAAGEWDVTNTDVQGFLDPLETMGRSQLAGVRASILGAGGAARAVAVALVSRGARVTIHARRHEQADDVAAACGAEAGPWPPTAGSWDLLVNCTPLGGPGARDDTPLPGGPFDGSVVYDLTYGDAEPPLLREAREAGCVTVNGLPMLIAQAERQFEWWTGTRPEAGAMRAAALRHIGCPVGHHGGR
jgi:3-dehydroquinate dehydratase/shikimate dehydrogenase